jgi:murein tripeptide amidase MpaA
MSIKISQQFDAGSVEIARAESAQDIELNIRKDSNSDFLQWFYFRLQGARGQRCKIRFLNAAYAAFPDGWIGYQVAASYDRENWFRVPTSYDGQVLTVTFTPERGSVYFAYFEPYSWDRHLHLLGRAEMSPLGGVIDLGSTLDGRDINAVVIGDPAAEKKVWVIARQHPGETMAEWFAEGLIEALLDVDNPIASQLLKRTAFYIVPNMNPDGSVRGNLRTNAAGINLNREWMAPSLDRSPEVFLVKNKIHEVGCDLFLDVHGDEALPYVFVAGCEMLENFSEQQSAQQQVFIDRFKQASREFQTEHGYAPGKYQESVLTLASKYIGHTFKCVSLTLEMPFKDNANFPDPRVGWNGARSAELGRAILQPILATLECGER